MRMNKPLLTVGISIPCSWVLLAILFKTGFFDYLEDISEGICYAILIIVLFSPVFIYMAYGIFNAAKTKPTIPKVKEKMPWDKGRPLDVDKEWREEQKQNK